MKLLAPAKPGMYGTAMKTGGRVVGSACDYSRAWANSLKADAGITTHGRVK